MPSFYGKTDQGRQVAELESKVSRDVAKARDSSGKLTSRNIPIEARQTRTVMGGEHVTVEDNGSVELPDHRKFIGQKVVISPTKSSNSGDIKIRRSNTGHLDGEDVDEVTISGANKRAVWVADESGWRRES